MQKLIVTSPSRLLTFVKEQLALTTKDLRFAIEHGRCFLNGRVERFSSTKLMKGDVIEIWPEKRPSFSREESRVLYEDETLLFYNKPHYISSSDLASLLKVQLVHRLDRDTTGVILFAKKDPQPFEELFRKRAIHKTYHAIVEGKPPQNGTFTANMKKIGSREGAVIWGIGQQGVFSETTWECEEYGNKRTLLRCHPKTGRTHQIRVHMKALGHPILGDCEYGNRTAVKGLFRPLLHASILTVESLTISAPLPSDFKGWLFS